MVNGRQLRGLAFVGALAFTACAAPNFQHRNVFLENGHKVAQPEKDRRFHHLLGILKARTGALTDQDVRRAATYAMAVLRDKRAVHALLEQHPDIPVIYSLGLSGDPAIIPELGKELGVLKYPLISLHDLAIINAMGRTRDKEAISHLCRWWYGGDAEKAKQMEQDILDMLDNQFILDAALPEIRGEMGLESPDSLRRALAAFALGWIGDKESVPKLSHLAFHDEYAFVRQEAVYALGMIGDQRAMPVLLKVLEHGDKNLRTMEAEAALAIAQMPNPLTKGLFDLLGHPRWKTRMAAALAIALSYKPSTIDTLVGFLDSSNTNHKREGAAHALGLIGDSRAAGPLIGCLFDAKTRVPMSPDHPQLGYTAAISLSLLHDEKIPEILFDAIRSIPFYEGKAYYEEEVMIGEAFAFLGLERSLPVLSKGLQTEKDKRPIVRILHLFQDERVIAEFSKLLSHPDPEIRKLGIEAMTDGNHRVYPEKSAEFVLGMLEDDDERVRAAAINSLVVAPSRIKIEEKIYPLLDDESRHVRMEAVSFPWKHIRPVESLTKLLEGDDAEIKRRVMITLLRLGEQGKVANVLMSDKDPVVRKYAALHLGDYPREEKSFKALEAAMKSDPDAIVRKAAKSSYDVLTKRTKK